MARQERVRKMLADITGGGNSTLTIDYSSLGTPRVSMAFTPFGVVAVDAVIESSSERAGTDCADLIEIRL